MRVIKIGNTASTEVEVAVDASGLRVTPRDLARIGSMMPERRYVGWAACRAGTVDRALNLTMVDVDEIHSYGHL